MKHANCLHGEGDQCVFCEIGEARGAASKALGTITGVTKLQEKKRPTFERCADKTLDQHVKTIYAGRGEQYGDSWDTKNACTHFTSEVYRMLEGVKRPSPEHLRLLQLASLIDVKISRMTGGYREDTIVDLIAYLAVYRTLREEYENQ